MIKVQTGNVLSGVPQGSVFGPILFILCMKDFLDIFKSVIKLFAADAKIYHTKDESDILKDDHQDFDLWADKWELQFNINKYNLLVKGK